MVSTELANNKRIAKNTIILYIRLILSLFISLYSSRIVLNALGVTDYGIYNVVGGFVSLFSSISGSLASSTQRFITYELGNNNYRGLSNVYTTSVLMHCCIAILIFILLETIGYYFVVNKLVVPPDRLETTLWVYHLSCITICIQIMNMPNNALVIAYEKMKSFAYISLLESILRLGIALLLTLCLYDRLKLYALMLFGITLVTNLIYLFYCKYSIADVRFHFVLDRCLMTNMFIFSCYSFIGNVAWVSFTQGLNVMLNLFFGPVVNAARGIAVQVESAITGFSSNFQMALNPQITKSYATGNIKYMRKLVFASAKYSFYLLFFLSLPVLIETNYILTIWLKVVPEYTVSFVRISLFISFVIVMINPLTVSVHASGNIRFYQLIIGVMQLMILPISYLFLSCGAKPESVFIVNLLVVFMSLFVRLHIVKVIIQTTIYLYIKKVMIPLFVVMILASIVPIVVYFVMPESFVRLIIVTLTSFLFTLFSVWKTGLAKSEKLIIISNIYKLKNGKAS